MTNLLTIQFESSRDSFDVRQFSVHEEISAPFEIDLVALCTSAARAYHGVCLSAEQIRGVPSGASTYSIRVGPRLALLGQRTNYRIFQHKTVQEIVRTVLSEWNVDHDWRIDTSGHPSFEYRVQYAETDLAFMHRLLASSGISYYFEHTSEATRLVLNDSPEQSPPRREALPYLEAPPGSMSAPYATEVRVAHGLRGGRLRIRDHDFRLGTRHVLAQEASAGDDLEQRLEEYRYQPGAFLTEGHAGGGTPVADDQGVARSDAQYGSRLVRSRLDRRRETRRRVSMVTTARDIGAGTVITVDGHPRSELSHEHKLLVTEAALSGSHERFMYTHIEALFAEEPFRPAAPPSPPKIHGVESATVVGPSGDEIYTDEYGRVRVQFHWDREGHHDERSSCWMRVSQGWAGTGFGIVALPRVGQEVLVSFVGGDPDQPLIVGRVYNATHAVPHSLPEHKTVSCWRTRSTPNGTGFNELRFEDKAGEEEVYLHAERDLREEVKRQHHLRVGASESIRVGAGQTVRVGGDQSVTVIEKRYEKIGKGDDLMVSEGDKTTEVATGDYVLTCDTGKIELKNAMAHILMFESRIELHTGRGAAITLDGDTISLAAKTIELWSLENVDVRAEKKVVVNGTDEVDVHGGMIKLNC
jgi:type VI secretion system secreted protein VgrG